MPCSKICSAHSWQTYYRRQRRKLIISAIRRHTFSLCSYSGSSPLELCCLVSWPLMRWYGRRPMILIGLLGALCSMFLIGGFGIPRPQPWTGWATGGACFFFTIAYSITIGPLVFTIITDIPSTRLRAKTAALARASYIATTLFNVIVTNYQANETAWDWRGKAGFFWAGSCILCLCGHSSDFPRPRIRLQQR